MTPIALLDLLDAPPRLRRHLELVHEVAELLIGELHGAWPEFTFDADAVRFGAATHDIGKALHPEELDGLLKQHVPTHLARFARTHANWETAEDELVALADKVWKGKRVDELEQAVAKRIAAATRVSPWEVFMTLDALLTRIADGADARLQRSR